MSNIFQGRFVRVVVLAVVALTITALSVGSVAAQDLPGIDEQLPKVSQVDASEDPVQLSLLAADYDVSESDVSILENGIEAEVGELISAVAVSTPIEVVYVIDVDNRNARDATLTRVGRMILAATNDLPAATRVGVVTAGQTSVARVPLTTSYERLERSLVDVRAERGASIYDGITTAAGMFSDEQGVARSVVVISGGGDTTSTATSTTAAASLVQRGAQAISLGLGESDQMRELTSSTGGAFIAVESNEQLLAQVGAVSEIALDRLLVTFSGSAEVGGRMPLAVTIGDKTIELSYPGGVFTRSVSQLRPLPAPPEPGFAFFGSSWVLYGSILLAFATIALAVGSLGSLFVGGDSNLDTLLARYSESDDLDESEVQELLVQSSLVRRAVDITEALAEDRGVLVRIEKMLERADLPMRAGEAMFFLLAAAVLAFALVWVVAKSVLMAVAVGGIVAAFGYFAVQFLARRRLRKFEQQLPDTLNMLAGTLRAGYSLPQGLHAVSDEMADPMGEELRRAMTENQLGREIDESLGGVAERLDSPDFAWAVMAIGIQREVGGNLNELLMTVADTMIQRQRIRREVSALTAEGRVSAGILSMLPPGLGFVLWVMNPDYVNVLFSNTIGLILLGAAVVSAMVGLIWMKKVITIDA